MKKYLKHKASKIHKGNRMSAGFTLAELMVAVAIIGIMAAVAVPTIMSGKANRELRAVSMGMYSDFIYARSEAAKRGVQVTIRFFQNNPLHTPVANPPGVFYVTGQENFTQAQRGEYAIFIDANGNGTWDENGNGFSDAGDDPLLKRVQMPNGVTINFVGFGGHRTRFDNRGIPTILGNVQFQSSDLRRYSFTMSQVGHARMRVSSDNGVTWSTGQ